MGTLSYGLNITKKPGLNKSHPPARRKPIFGDDEDDDEDGRPESTTAQGGQVEELDTIGGLSSPTTNDKSGKASSKPPPPPTSKKSSNPITTNLSSKYSSSKHTDEATALDASIYDYDASYDAVKAAREGRKSKGQSEEDKTRKPKYMESLLASVETRKRDQLRAKDKLLAKEREEEGDEYADKEKFVTEAYKEQQEEVRKMEEEERLREEAEARRKKAGLGGMGAFYRGMLDKTEEQHDVAVKAAESSDPKTADAGEETDKETESETQEAARLRAQGKNVTLNDEGQVVDKRQLLGAGLNAPSRDVTSQKKADSARGNSASGVNRPTGPPSSRAEAQRAQRERQTRMLEDQLAQAAKRSADEEIQEQQGLERASKSRKTEGDIGSAKERYLARKREREAAAKGGS